MKALVDLAYSSLKNSREKLTIRHGRTVTRQAFWLAGNVADCT
jgi:hypothetical protein